MSDKIFLLACRTSDALETIVDAEGLRDHFVLARSPENRSEARNDLIELVEGKQVAESLLWMLAGERFDDATAGEFRRFIDTEFESTSIYMMILRRLVRSDCRRHDLDEETIGARLMPLNKGLRFDNPVKETLFDRAKSLLISVSAAPGRILSPSDKLDRSRRKHRGSCNLSLIENLEKQGLTIQNDYLAFRAEARADLGDYLGAKDDLLRLIGEAKQSNLILKAYYDLWEVFAFSALTSDKMLKILLDALDRFPVDMQLLTFIGVHLQRQGKIDLAIRSFETAVRFGQISLDVWHRLHIREIAVVSLALAYRLQGNASEAIRVLEANRELIDDRSEYDRYLLDLYIAEFQETRAHDLVATIWGDRALDQMKQAVTGACRAKAAAWEAALIPLESAYVDGCRDLLCLRWYSLTLTALRRFGEAIPVLEEWVAASPESLEARSYLQAARNPDRFDEIVRTMRDEHLKALGAEAGTVVEIDSPLGAVGEIVRASGSFAAEIQTSTDLSERTHDIETDFFEIDSADNGAADLVFRPKQ